MNIFQKTFAKGPAYIGYLTAGHKGMETTKKAAFALLDGGVDILEIGVPFSDPIADGPIIQAACLDSLKHKTTIQQVLSLIKDIKEKRNIPIVLFSYANPFFQTNNIYLLAKQAGVDAILLVDYPYEESAQHFLDCQKHDIDPVCLIAPTTSEKRIKIISQHCRSFLYYVCRNNITGIQKGLPDDFITKAKTIKKVTSTAVVAGFGVSNAESAGKILSIMDGFVVGSFFVDAVQKGTSPSELTALAQSLDPRK